METLNTTQTAIRKTSTTAIWSAFGLFRLPWSTGYTAVANLCADDWEDPIPTPLKIPRKKMIRSQLNENEDSRVQLYASRLIEESRVSHPQEVARSAIYRQRAYSPSPATHHNPHTHVPIPLLVPHPSFPPA